MKFNKIKTVIFFVALFYCFSLFSESALAISDSEIDKRLQEIEDNSKNPRSGLSNEDLERVLNYLKKRYSEIGGDTKEEKYFNAVDIYKNSKMSFVQIVPFITLAVLFLFLLLILVSNADFFSKIRRKIETTNGGDELFLLLFLHTMFFFGISTMFLLVNLYYLTQFYF